jgi:SNF2 family DNA or RNA helicase
VRASIYHGSMKLKSELLLCDYDIVITTYETIAAEHETERALLKRIAWFRIVLDEGEHGNASDYDRG